MSDKEIEMIYKLDENDSRIFGDYFVNHNKE